MFSECEALESRNADFERARRFHVLITKEDEGGFSVTALNLPGTGSCGDTINEAMENFKEAARAVLEVYGDDIPWVDSREAEIPFGSEHKWIIVDV